MIYIKTRFTVSFFVNNVKPLDCVNYYVATASETLNNATANNA